MDNGSFSSNVYFTMIGLTGLQAYSAILLVLFACGMGLPIPEDITLFAAGYLAYSGHISLTGAILVGLVGVLIGDTCMYWIGRIFGRKVFYWPIFRKMFTPERIRLAERKIQRNARIICFTSRFAPGLRAPVYLTSGILKVPFPVFIGMDGLAALISVPVWVYLAYFLGDKIEQLLDVAKKAKFGVIAVIILLIASYIFLRIRKRRKESFRGLASSMEKD